MTPVSSVRPRAMARYSLRICLAAAMEERMEAENIFLATIIRPVVSRSRRLTARYKKGCPFCL